MHLFLHEQFTSFFAKNKIEMLENAILQAYL